MTDKAIQNAMQTVKQMADIMAATGMSSDQINQALKGALPAVNQMITADRERAQAERSLRTLVQVETTDRAAK